MKYNKIGFLKILMVCACIIAIYGAQAQTIKSDFAPGMQLFRIENHNSPEGKYALLAVQHPDSTWEMLKLTELYLLQEGNTSIPLAYGDYALPSCYEVSISPDSKYIALYFVAEGHPWIEVYDLQWLINKKELKLLKDLNPYPGIVNIVKWKKNQLVLESDVNLLRMNDGHDLIFDDMMPVLSKFKLNMNSLKIENY